LESCTVIVTFARQLLPWGCAVPSRSPTWMNEEAVGVGVGVKVAVLVGVRVFVGVPVGVGVNVGDAVEEAVELLVGVQVGVPVAVGVPVGVLLGVVVGVGVGVGRKAVESSRSNTPSDHAAVCCAGKPETSKYTTSPAEQPSLIPVVSRSSPGTFSRYHDWPP
jgi:hypothetical protein